MSNICAGGRSINQKSFLIIVFLYSQCLNEYYFLYLPDAQMKVE